MDITQRLIRAMRETGLYKLAENRRNYAELLAVGKALCEAEAELSMLELSMLPLTADVETLGGYRRLFGISPAVEGEEILRRSILSLFRIGGDGFTKNALEDAVISCGVTYEIEENGINEVVLRCVDVRGIPPWDMLARSTIERFIPSHLSVSYVYDFTTWDDLSRWRVTFDKVEGLAWNEFETYLVNE